MKLKKLLAMSILLLGGVFMFFSLNNNREMAKQQEAELLRQESELLLKEQESIALYLVNKYENIEKLTFDKISKNKKTGSNRIYIYINEDILVAIVFGDYGENDYRTVFHKNRQKLVKSNNTVNKTLENIDISYYEGDVK